MYARSFDPSNNSLEPHNNNNKCCSKPDQWTFSYSLIFILLPSILFVIFVIPQLISHHTNWVIPILIWVYMDCLSVVSLIICRSTDPGILPRNPNPHRIDSHLVPHIKEIRTPNGLVITMKFCETCQIWRPPRASHCSTCNNCVERFDHHCPWTGNCIGKRNYRYFLIFVYTTTFNLVFTFGLCLTNLILIAVEKREDGSTDVMGDAVRASPVSVIIVVFTFFLVWSLLGLCGYHCSLVTKGQTTNEELKESDSYHYNDGCCTNFSRSFCGPFYPSFFYFWNFSRHRTTNMYV